MKKKIDINILDKTTSEIKKFEKREWHIADIEHYGKDWDFEKKKYKFIARGEDGDIQGILNLLIWANVALIEGILVASECRGRGIGKKLMSDAEKFSKKNKCNKIWLETNEEWGAVKFYEKIGYKITGKHEKHYLNKRGLIFTKFI